MDANPFTEICRKLKMVGTLGNTDFVIKSKKTSQHFKNCA